MPAEYIINEIVDLNGSVKDLDALLVQINRVELAIQAVNKNPINLGNVGGMKELRQATNELLQATKNLNKAIDDTTKVTKTAADADLKAAKAKTEESKQATEASKAKVNEAKAATENAKAKQIENKERDAAAKLTANENKLVNQISDEYKQLSLAYNEAALKSKNYYLTLGANHPITLEAQKDARALKSVLDTVDQATGDYRRNVGNYGSALNNLRIQTGQLLRETPNLALNAQTFILSLSNNLPLFFEAIERVKKGNEELAATGQKPVSVFRQILGSLFSLQSALTIGVTLLTVFSGKIIDWVGGLFKGKDKTAELTKEIAAFDKVVRESSKRVEEFNNTLQFLQKLGRINIDISVLNSPQLGKLKGDLDDLRALSIDQLTTTDNLEKSFNQLRETSSNAYQVFLDQLTASDKLLLDQNGGYQNAQFVTDQLSKNAAKAFDAYTKVSTALDDTGKQLANSQSAQTIIYRQIAKQKGDIDKEQAAQTRKLILETTNSEADIQKRKSEAVLNDERSTLDQRLAALKKYLNAEKATIDAQKNDVLANPESSPEERKIAVNKANAAAFSSNKDYEEKVFKMKEEFRIKDIEAEKQIFTQKKQLQADQLKQLADNNEFSLQDRVSFQNGAISAQRAIIDKEYEAKKESVKNTYLTDVEKFAIESDYNNKVIELYRKAQDDITNILKSAIDKQQELKEQDVEQTKDIYSHFSDIATSSYNDEVKNLLSSLKLKEISYDKYLKKRKELDEKYKADSIKLTLSEIQAELNAFNGAEAFFSAAQINLYHLKEKLSKAITEDEKSRITKEIDVAQKTYDVAKKNVEKKKQLLRELSQAEKEAAEASAERDKNRQERATKNAEFVIGRTVDFISRIQSLYDTLSDSRIQQYEIEKDALENRYQREIDMINQTYVNAVDRDRALAEAKAKNAAAKKQLDEKEKAENIKKAKFDKDAAIFSIILNTAKAIVADLGNPFKMAFDAAIGAVELAIAIAQPLPRYFKGKNVDQFTSDSYEGYAWVNDGGKKEAIIRGNGKVELPQKMNTVEWIGAKDIVLPDANMLAWQATKSASESFVFITTSDSNGLSRQDYMHGVRTIKTAIQNQPRTRQINTKDALMSAWISSNKSWGEFFR